MAKQNFNLEKFIATSKKYGLARTNRFEVLITPPPFLGTADPTQNSELASLFCEVSNLPPLNINVKPYRIFGPLHQMPVSSDYGGDGISMTFHLDGSMFLKRFFDDWMEGIVDGRGANGPQFTVRYKSDYSSTIILRQLSPSNKPLEAGAIDDLDEEQPVVNPGEGDDVSYEVELIEAFPRSMNLVEFNNAAQNQTQRLTIVFAYRYWRRTDVIKKIAVEKPKHNQNVPQPQPPKNVIKQQSVKNVSFTGVYSPGTTTDDMAMGVGQLSG